MGIGSFFKSIVKVVTAPFEWLVDLFVPDIPQPQMPGDPGTEVNRRGGANYLPLVYANKSALSRVFTFFNPPNHGLVKVGAVESHISTSGDKNKYLHLTYVIDSGMQDGYFMVKADAGEFNFASGEYATIAFYNRHLGGEDDGAYSLDTTQIPFSNNTTGEWSWKYAFITANNTFVPSWHNDKNKYPGLNVFKITLRYPNDDESKDQTWTRRKPDLRFYISGLSTYENAAVTDYMGSTDSTMVSMLFHYLTDKRVGAGVPVSEIDVDSFLDVKYGASFMTQVLGLFNIDNWFYRIDTNSSVVTNIKNMLWHMACSIIYEDGKFVLRVDPNYLAYDHLTGFIGLSDLGTMLTGAGITTYTATEDDIINGIKVHHLQNSDVPYQYNITYTGIETENYKFPADPNTYNRFLQDEYGDVLRPQTDDRMIKDIPARGPGPAIKHRYVESLVNNIISLTLSPKFANIRIYDLIAIQYPLAELDGERFVVTDVSRNPDMSVTVTAKQFLPDADLGTNFSTKNIQSLIFEQNLSWKKAQLVVPVGYGYDNNTQVDEFVPGLKLPTIDNLTLSSTVADGLFIANNQWLPGINISFDEIFEPNVNTYHIYHRHAGTNKWSKMNDYTFNDEVTGTIQVKLNSSRFISGMTNYIKVVPVSEYGTEGTGATASIVVPRYRYSESVSRNYIDINTYPVGYVITETNGQLDEDKTGSSWIQLQGTIAPDNGTWGGGTWTAPADSDHSTVNTTSEVPQAVHEYLGQWGNNTSTPWAGVEYPGIAWPSVIQEATYESNSPTVFLEEGDQFHVTGSVDVQIRHIDGTTEPCRYALGWRVYDSLDNLLNTYTPDPYNDLPSGTEPGVWLVGGVANQAYAKLYIKAYGQNTDGSDSIVLYGWDLQIHRNITNSYTVNQVNTSLLSGSTGDRQVENINYRITLNDNTQTTLPAFEYPITNVTITSHLSETDVLTGSYLGQTGTAHRIKVTDVNTGSTADGTVNITFYGFPYAYMDKNDDGIYTELKIVGER